MKPLQDMNEAEAKGELETLRALMVRAVDIDTAEPDQLRREVLSLRGLVGNAMSLAELLRLQLAVSQSELAAARGQLQ